MLQRAGWRNSNTTRLSSSAPRRIQLSRRHFRSMRRPREECKGRPPTPSPARTPPLYFTDQLPSYLTALEHRLKTPAYSSMRVEQRGRVFRGGASQSCLSHNYPPPQGQGWAGPAPGKKAPAAAPSAAARTSPEHIQLVTPCNFVWLYSLSKLA